MAHNQQNYKEKQNINNDREIQLLEENKNLRRKLKLLSVRLDDELEKAAKQKLKVLHTAVSTSTAESQSLQLQNAYKMIQRLQKTVKDFQGKQAYQISFKRILDLESLINKKQSEMQQIKGQLKDAKKTIREKQKHISDLLDSKAVNLNINEEKQQIQKLKQTLKKVMVQNDQLKKKQLQKHKKLVTAQRKLVQIEQQDEQPIGRQQQMLQKLNQYKTKYKEAMVRIQKQNAYITKLNTKISTIQQSNSHKRVRSYHTSEPKQISRSMQQLPSANKKAIILQHIPSINIPNKSLKRY